MFSLIRAILAGASFLDDVKKLKRQLADLEDDVSALSDRHERLAGRLAKRRERGDTQAPPAPETTDEESSRRAELNRMILQRRNGGGRVSA